MSTPGAGELSRLLRQLVGDAGMSAAEVGRRIGKSESTMSRYLQGVVVPKPAVVRSIIAAIGAADHEVADEAARLADDLVAPRVVVLRPGTLTAQRRWAEAEAETALVRDFGALIVPGLLQSAPYARAVFTAAGQTGQLLEGNVRARMRRQECLAESERRFVEVLTEGALRWQVLAPDLMVEQCDAVASRAREGGQVQVGFIPWTRTVSVFPMTNFTIYDERAVVVGTDFGTAYIAGPRDVAIYVEQHRQLCNLAVFGEDAAREVERVGREYRAVGG